MRSWLLGFFTLGMIVLVGYNINLDIGEFFKIPIYHVLNLLCVVGVSFVLTQKFTDERKQKEIIDNVIVKLKEVAGDEKFHTKQSLEKKDILQLTKMLKAKISFLKKSSSKFKIKDLVESIESYESEIHDLFDQFSSSDQILTENKSQFNRVLTNIDNKCDEIRLKLYFNN